MRETCRIAIVGGGIAGLSAAYQLSLLVREGASIEPTLFEASERLGGIVETVHDAGFTIECGPDAWVTEKPWARLLAEELDLADQIMPSNDATRKTYVLIGDSQNGGGLVAMPDRMRMMVPVDEAALEGLARSALFSADARAAYRREINCADELKATAPDTDESVASFVRRHFGDEVLIKIGAPLLSGVFGGDVATLSVRAVMAPFVAMEREHGSLILALQARAERGPGSQAAVFTTLRGGLGTLIDAMARAIPETAIHRSSGVTAIARTRTGWRIQTPAGEEHFDRLLLATPVDVAQRLLAPTASEAAALMEIETSSAVVVAFGFTGEAASRLTVPPGFGFLVPPEDGSKSAANSLLAATFVDQKFAHRVPEGGRLIRAFFGGATADRLLDRTDGAIADLARKELSAILGAVRDPAVTVVRRWPRALPQYAVGHLERMVQLDDRVKALGHLWLLGNGYRGVGLPDLIRDARTAAREAVIT